MCLVYVVNRQYQYQIQEGLGQICWLEVPVRNVDRAKQFYGDIFSWNFSLEPGQAVGDCIKSMHFFDKGQTLHGALLEVDEHYQVINNVPDRPGALAVMPTFCVEDCEKTLEKVASAGGKTAM